MGAYGSTLVRDEVDRINNGFNIYATKLAYTGFYEDYAQFYPYIGATTTQYDGLYKKKFYVDSEEIFDDFEYAQNAYLTSSNYYTKAIYGDNAKIIIDAKILSD